jgi:glutaminyl-peptide cyclotransferase
MCRVSLTSFILISLIVHSATLTAFSKLQLNCPGQADMKQGGRHNEHDGRTPGKPSRRRRTAFFGIPLSTWLSCLVCVLLVFAIWLVRIPRSSSQLDPGPVSGEKVPSAQCCSTQARGAVAARTALKITDELLALGPRVGGGANPLGDGYFKVLEMLALRPPTVPYRRDLQGGCPCLLEPEVREFMWKLSWDNFTDRTPLGPKTFSNVLWTFEPERTLPGGNLPQSASGSRRHIVLAAHWDSKLLPPETRGGQQRFFVGACDSAVPVAMIITLMHVIQEHAVHLESAEGVPKFTVMLFDGEEAFVEWRGLDNTYGSRHLAKEWADRHDGTGSSSLLASISLFVLFDLMGPYGPTFRNFFPRQTGHQYDLLRRLELRLRRDVNSPMKTNQRREGSGWTGTFFPTDSGFAHGVDDDHKPWLERNVSVLHLIPVPFPDVWHTVRDDRQAVDDDTVHDLMLIFEEFVKRMLRRVKK